MDSVWWDAMRKVRTLKEAGFRDDDEILFSVERTLLLEPGTASVQDLLDYYEEEKRYGTSEVAKVPEDLSWGEILTELAKLPEYEGSSPEEVEESTGAKDIEELEEILDSLGGPSSSCPLRSEATRAEVIKELKEAWGADGWEVAREFGGGYVSSAEMEDFLRGGEEERSSPEPSGYDAKIRDDDLRRDKALSRLRDDYLGRYFGMDNETIAKALGEDYGFGEATLSQVLAVLSQEGLDNEALERRAPFDPIPMEDPERISDPWWSAMRDLRTDRYPLRDDHLVSLVEAKLGLPPGTATARDLETLIEARGGPSKNVSYVPAVLSRSEALTEIGKYERYFGMTSMEVEEAVPREGRFPTVGEIRRHLNSLGGPSSSSPDRTVPRLSEALKRLGEKDRFRGMRGREIAEEARNALGAGALGLEDYEELLWDFESWERGKKDSPHGPSWSSPSQVLGELRETEKYRGMTDQEIIEEIEGDSGPSSPGRYEEALRGKRSPRRSPPTAPKDGKWWEALRKARSLTWSQGTWDGLLLVKVGNRFGKSSDEVTTADLNRYYDISKSRGTQEARYHRPLSRSELMTELAKYPRYENLGEARIEEEVPGEGNVATTGELRKHLLDLGGPSTSSPETAPGRWNAMRGLRTLAKYGNLSDKEIELRAKRGPGTPSDEDLAWLLRGDSGRREEYARVPKRLSRGEVLLELSKIPRYSSAERLNELGSWSDDELMSHLELLGGPSSSSPLG